MKYAAAFCIVAALFAAGWVSAQDYGSTHWVVGVLLYVGLFTTACICALLAVRRQPPPDQVRTITEVRSHPGSDLSRFNEEEDDV